MATVFTDQITGSGETVAYKAPCRVATTANIALSGLLTVDSVVLVADDRVLVKNQTAPSENGIWIANSGAWKRARDFDSKRDIARGTRTNVTDGTVNGGREYRILGNNPIIVGTDAITISETLSSDSGSNAAAAQAAADAAQAVLADPNFVAVAGIADEIATVAGLAPDIPGIPANVTAAQLAETNAQKWATNPEDVEVTPGLFSAFHWYRKSLAIWTNLTNTVAGWIHGSGTKIDLVDADEFGIADSEWSWALSKVSWANIKAGIASATMTLTNKTLIDATTFFADNGDATKKLQFQLSGFTTATTRTVTWPNADGTVLLTTVDATVTAGFTATAVSDGTKTSGTYTPTPAGGNFKTIINGGAFTLAAPNAAGSYNLTIDITNNATAGAITFTGFVTGNPKGSTLTTTNGHKFKLHISKTAAGVTATIEACQ